MNKHLQVQLLGWSYYPEWVCDKQPQPTDEGGTTRLSSEELDLSFIPAALRRRCSLFSRVTLAVARAAAGDCGYLGDLPTVFASAHGEGGITAELLCDLAREQQLSPMGFSLSVHNAASGLFSIALQDRGASTALAAGEETYLMGLCEALLSISDSPCGAVLYVCSDDLVPEEFLPTGAQQSAPSAIAMVLGDPARFSGCSLSLEYRPIQSPAYADQWRDDVRRMAQWLSEPMLSGSDGELSLRGADAEWIIRKSAESVPLMRSAKRRA